MASNTVLTGATLAAGTQSNFMQTYMQSFDGVAQELGSVMQLQVPTIFRTTPYAFRRTMPYPRLWKDGNAIPTEGTDSLPFSVTVRDYATRVEWNRNDRADNQVGDIMADAQQAGRNFASIDSRALFEIALGTPSLLPAIPVAPDGAAIYSATAEGGDRFGVTGGNIVATAAVMVTSQEVQAAVFAALARFGNFLNTKGQPYFEPNLATESYTVYAPVDRMEIFTQAFAANVVMQSPAATAAAGVSNVIMASGVNIRLVFTNRIPAASNTFFVFRDDAPVKAVFSVEREGMRSAVATEGNSDKSRDTKIEYVQFTTRRGHGVNQPFATIQVTHT